MADYIDDRQSRERWTEVDRYLLDLMVPSDSVLEDTLRASAEAGLPAISISPLQGKLLQILAAGMKARRVLEIGTLGGYSTIWLARALPADGHLVTIEADPKHTEVARANIARANLSDIVDVRLGIALEVLPQIEAERRGPFDMIFIDANKDDYPEYFRWSLKLAHRGSLIVADNVVRHGAVADASVEDPRVRGVRQFHEMVAAESRVIATAIQTVGSKGHDGLAFILVNSE